MNYPTEQRSIIQGNLINAQRVFVPGSEDHPRNFLLFAHFDKTRPNHHYFLAKEGNGFEGKYVGKADMGDGRVKGVDTLIYPELIRFADMHLQDKSNYTVEIKLSRKI